MLISKYQIWSIAWRKTEKQKTKLLLRDPALQASNGIRAQTLYNKESLDIIQQKGIKHRQGSNENLRHWSQDVLPINLVFMQAFTLFKESLAEGYFAQYHWNNSGPPPAHAEINLHAMTAGVAILSLYAWLMSLKARVQSQYSENQTGSPSRASKFPARLAIVTDKGKVAKEQGNLVVKEAVSAIMSLWDAPFKWVPGNVFEANSPKAKPLSKSQQE